MSKYTLAKEHLGNVIAGAEQADDDPSTVIEALIVLAIQELKQRTSPAHVRNFLQYEVDSLGSGGVYEIQKR